jgi:type II secretory pathway pseudopilin PulG
VLLMFLPCISFLMILYLLFAPTSADAPAPSGGGGGAATGLIVVAVAFVGIMMIGIIAAIAIPSLLRARVSANEAMAIGDARSIVSAQMAYSTENNNFYEGRMECLGAPAQCLPGSTQSGLDPLLLAPSGRGYRRELVAGPPAPPLAARSPSSVSSFAFVLRPMTPGQTGIRSFCADYTGRVCQSFGTGELVTRTAEDVQCSDECQVF